MRVGPRFGGAPRGFRLGTLRGFHPDAPRGFHPGALWLAAAAPILATALLLARLAA